MRPQFRSVLVGLGWVVIIGVLGATVGGPINRQTFFGIVAIVAAILALVAKQKPRRITRIVVLLGALVCVGINYPKAAAEARWYIEQRNSRGVSNTMQPSPSANSNQTNDGESDR